MTEPPSIIHYTDHVIESRTEPTSPISYCGLTNEEVCQQGQMMDSKVCFIDTNIFSQCPECAEHPRIQMETLALTKL